MYVKMGTHLSVHHVQAMVHSRQALMVHNKPAMVNQHHSMQPQLPHNTPDRPLKELKQAILMLRVGVLPLLMVQLKALRQTLEPITMDSSPDILRLLEATTMVNSKVHGPYDVQVLRQSLQRCQKPLGLYNLS